MMPQGLHSCSWCDSTLNVLGNPQYVLGFSSPVVMEPISAAHQPDVQLTLPNFTSAKPRCRFKVSVSTR